MRSRSLSVLTPRAARRLSRAAARVPAAVRGTALALALMLLAVAGPARAATLYDQLGAQDGITRLVAGLYRIVLADPRIKAKFDNIDTGFIERELVQQICELAGGPCHYRGPSMHGGHAGLGITDRDFNALVEDLQDAMDQAGTPFGTQGRLLAVLAPMHAQIVTR